MAAGKLGQVAHYKRQREQLLQIRDDMDAQVLQKQAVVDAMSARLAALEEEKNGTMVYLAQLSAQMEKLQEIEKQSHQKEELAMLKKLIALNETLKRQEAEFKASCKSQLQELEENVKALEQAVGEDNEDSRRLREIEEMHQQVLQYLITR
jgi:chromosome segregation ATPase